MRALSIYSLTVLHLLATASAAYESLDFSGDAAHRAKLVYTRISAGGTTYSVLARVSYDIVGE